MGLHMDTSYSDPNWRWGGMHSLVRAADTIGPQFRAALKASAPIGDPLNDLTPGRLQRSIRYARYVQGNVLRMEFTAHTPYAGMVISGTAPHIIRPRAARALRWNTPAGPHFATVVHHPGTDPNPFPHRALHALKTTIVHEFALQLGA